MKLTFKEIVAEISIGLGWGFMFAPVMAFPALFISYLRHENIPDIIGYALVPVWLLGLAMSRLPYWFGYGGFLGRFGSKSRA